MKEYLVGFSIAIIAAVAIYFFYVVPETKRVHEKIEEAYQKGFEDCSSGVDTVFIPGQPILVYRDTTVYIERPAEVLQKDTAITVASSIDTTFISGKDSLRVKASVGIDVNLANFNSAANWFMQLEHKDYENTDTLIMKVPKLIKTVEYETNWFYVALAFLTGSITMLLSFIL
jgi:hypothetical protein